MTLLHATLIVGLLAVRSECFQPAAFLPRDSSTRSIRLPSALPMARGPPRGRMNRMPIKEARPVMNSEITQNELRVITPTAKGKDLPLGVMTLAEALAKAKEMGNLDVIMVNDKSDPPVCKIVDYSKHRYMLEKKAKEVKKNSKASELKEVKMSYKIDVHDYGVRKKSASKFLLQGNRVKCTVMFRGREVQHEKLGFDLLERLAAELEDTCARDGKPKREGRNISLILSPRAEVLKSIGENRRAEEKAKKKRKQAELEARAASKAGVTVDGEAVDVSPDEAVVDDDEDFDDEDYDDDDEDDDDGDSLSELLGSDDITESLFKS